MIELQAGVVVDHPLELLLRVEGGGPCGVGPPLLLEAVTVVDPDLKPDGSGQAEEDEETDGEEEEKLDWVGGTMVQVLQKSSPALVRKTMSLNYFQSKRICFDGRPLHSQNSRPSDPSEWLLPPHPDSKLLILSKKEISKKY